MKRNLNAADEASLSQVFDMEAEHMVRSMMTEDHANADHGAELPHPLAFFALGSVVANIGHGGGHGGRGQNPGEGAGNSARPVSPLTANQGVSSTTM